MGSPQYEKSFLQANPLYDPFGGLGVNNSAQIAPTESKTGQRMILDDNVKVGDVLENKGTYLGGTITDFYTLPQSNVRVATFTASPENRVKQAQALYDETVQGLTNTQSPVVDAMVGRANTLAEYLNTPAAQEIRSNIDFPKKIEAPAIESKSGGKVRAGNKGATKVKRPPATVLNSLKPQGKALTGQ